MEVHPPHGLHHKKNWKEYITEFLMLFLAVTLGFFVENYREHHVERNREKEFLRQILQDVDMDLKLIETNIGYRNIRAGICEELIRMFQQKEYVTRTGPFYLQARRINVRYYFERSDAGFQQLKNAGGLRLIHNSAIVSAIQRYDQTVATIGKFQDSEIVANVEYRNASALVLDAQVVVTMNARKVSNYDAFIEPPGNPRLHSYDGDRLNSMMSAVHSIDRINHVVMHFEETLKSDAAELKAAILASL